MGEPISDGGTPFRFEVSSESEHPAWDAFVCGCQDPHPEQTSAWGRVQRLRGWAPVRVVARHDDRAVGGAQVLERRVRGLFRVGYLFRGPLAVADSVLLRQALVQALRELARRRHWVYLAMVLPYSGTAFIPDFERSECSAAPDFLPPRTRMKSTLVLDLTQDLESIQAGMRATTRNLVRQGQRCGASFFKLGFGGKLMLLHPNYCYLQPLLRLCLGLAGSWPLTASTPLFSRLRRRTQGP